MMNTEPDRDDMAVEPLFARIGAMLARHGLDPTPAHYALCHAYLSGEDTLESIVIDRAIARHGGLTPDAVAAMQDPASEPISPETLQALADDAAVCLERVTGVMEDNGRAVRAYGDALAGGVQALTDEPPASGALAGLVALTRRMIDRSRDASDHLRRTGAEINTLRDKLTEARHIADSDPLTGLPNRRALDLRITQACLAARETGEPLTVAICDIDRFKRVNDAHGHIIGDEVIRLVAAALDTVSDSYASRYGGEEFVLLFENVPLHDAADRIDAVRRGLSARDISITATGLRIGHITFSAGVAAIGPCGRPSVMLRRADKALYRAKRAGRDRVMIDAGED